MQTVCAYFIQTVLLVTGCCLCFHPHFPIPRWHAFNSIQPSETVQQVGVVYKCRCGCGHKCRCKMAVVVIRGGGVGFFEVTSESEQYYVDQLYQLCLYITCTSVHTLMEGVFK